MSDLYVKPSQPNIDPYIINSILELLSIDKQTQEDIEEVLRENDIQYED